MKLYSLETFIVKNPPPAFGGRYFIFVRLETACGIVGTGEIYAGSFAPDIICRMAQDVFARYLADHSPFNIETFWRRAHGSGFSHRPDPSMQAVISGLEMACWDIIGKALDRPVYDLLGGQVHRRLRTYSYIYPENGQDAARFYQDPDASAATAARYVKAGFTAVKCDPVGAYTVFDGRQPDPETLQRAAIFCRQIRAAVTDRADLLFGTHGQFTAVGAIAETHYAQIAPHLYCGPIVAAANIQLATSIPNFLILETIGKMDGFHAALLVKPLCWEDGYMIPPTGPGLGVELNMDMVLANPWDGDRLHLEMTPDPYDNHLHRHFAGG
jgi:L-alanine-DL-glutamate epimerase-like enolase superfamily enzyme